jgi:hypothetical protein
MPLLFLGAEGMADHGKVWPAREATSQACLLWLMTLPVTS